MLHPTTKGSDEHVHAQLDCNCTSNLIESQNIREFEFEMLADSSLKLPNYVFHLKSVCLEMAANLVWSTRFSGGGVLSVPLHVFTFLVLYCDVPMISA